MLSTYSPAVSSDIVATLFSSLSVGGSSRLLDPSELPTMRCGEEGDTGDEKGGDTGDEKGGDTGDEKTGDTGDEKTADTGDEKTGDTGDEKTGDTGDEAVPAHVGAEIREPGVWQRISI
jgi:hypothetical protein